MHRFGPFTLDESRFELRRQGVRVALQPKAFDLLLLLVHRDGEVVTKAEAMRSVWPDARVTPCALTQVVRVLRRSLGADGGGAIRTVRGRGYRFVPPCEARASVREAVEGVLRLLGEGDFEGAERSLREALALLTECGPFR